MINPVAADNWLGAVAMDTARARLREAICPHDRNGRFRIYHSVTARGKAIYVRSKLMIVDEKVMRVGSSNFNNRSMRFDNECDVAFEADDDVLAGKLLGLRNDLLAEHLGVSVEAVTATIGQAGSLIGAVETLRQSRGSGGAGTSGTLDPTRHWKSPAWLSGWPTTRS